MLVPRLTFLNFAQLILDLLDPVLLKRHLSQLIGIPVDLVLKKTLKPNIGRYILAEVVVIG